LSRKFKSYTLNLPNKPAKKYYGILKLMYKYAPFSRLLNQEKIE